MTTWFTQKRRSRYGILVLAAALALLCCVMLQLDWFSTARLRAGDLFFTDDGSSLESGGGETVLVAIDDATLDRLGSISDWPRTYYADMVDSLTAAGARVIVFDVLFSEPSPGDAAFAVSLETAGNVVLPAAYTCLSSASENATGTGESCVLEPLPGLTAAALSVGHSNVSPDADGVVRRLPVLLDDADTARSSLSVAAVAAFLRRPVPTQAPLRQSYLELARRRIPLYPDGQMLVNYDVASTDSVSFIDVREGHVDGSIFDDRIVIIGSTANALSDFFWTPLGTRLAGVEVHAAAMNTILSNDFLRPVPAWITMAIMVVLAFTCVWLVRRFSTIPATGFVLLLAGAYLLACFLAFENGILMDMLFPFILIGSVFIAGNLYLVVYERRQKHEITQTFGRYISPAVVQKIMAARENGELVVSGEQRNVTTLFADVRNFTAITEHAPPDVLVRDLNRYLSLIIAAIMRYDGIVNKFGGDSIMAIWNAPVPCDNGAYNAVRAAIEGQRRMRELHETDPAMLHMEFGIGIETGTAVIGSIGSAERLEYSVIGDSVNTAARIAGAAGGGDIWVGSNAYRDVQTLIEADDIPPVPVKGKSEPLRLYRVVGLKQNEES